MKRRPGADPGQENGSNPGGPEPSTGQDEVLAAVAGDGRAALEALLRALRAHARDAYPEECCGLVSRHPGPLHGLVVHRGRNLAIGPGGGGAGPRAKGDAFLLDPGDLVRAERWAGRHGGRLVAVYHSHVDGDARLSARDRLAAAPGGRPAWPRLGLLVVAVSGGGGGAVALYRWEPTRRRHVEVPVASLVRGPGA